MDIFRVELILELPFFLALRVLAVLLGILQKTGVWTVVFVVSLW